MSTTTSTTGTTAPGATAPAPELLVAALSYAVAGWPVLPLHTPRPGGACSCARHDCASPAKHPRTEHGLNDASTDPGQIAAWWRHWPDANVGVRTGELVVIDIDGATGRRSLRALEAAHGTLPATRCATSA